MELSNYEEYKFLRDELQNLKNCITNYVGYVLGGSGIAFIGFHFIKGDETIAFVSLILTIILSLVLSIIFYKFNSHNRYAGYCKLLDQEQITVDDDNNVLNDQSEYIILSWEICINRLRYSDFEDKPFQNLYSNYDIDNILKEDEKEKIKSFSGKKKSADNWKFYKGIRILIEAFFGKLNTKSWQFPLFIIGVFLVLTVIYLSLSIYLYSQVLILYFNFSNAAYAILLFLLFRMWILFIGKLYSLLEGSSTVDAFCWKFYPIRYCFIKRKFENVQYSLITLTEENSN